MTGREVVSRAGNAVLNGAQARGAWEQLAASNSDLPVSQLPQWVDCVCASGRFVDATRAYTTADGRMVVLPLVRRRGTRGRLAMYESWPFLWDGGRDNSGLVSDGPVRPDDVRMVLDDLASLPAARVRVVPSTSDAEVWAVAVPPALQRVPMSAHVVTLPAGGGPPVRAGLVPGARRKVNKAEEVLVVESDTTGRLLPVFDGLYRRSVEEWAGQHWLPRPAARRLLLYREPAERLADVARRLGERCRVWIAYRAGEPVGGIVVLSAGPAATYWKGATDKQAAGSLGVGQLLHVRAMEEAQAEGRLRYDLGSSGSPSLAQFKSGLGGRPVSYCAYVLENLPLTASERALRGAARTVLTQVAAARSRRR